MADTVRQVDYFYMQVSDKAGEGAKVLRALKDAGVNLLAGTVKLTRIVRGPPSMSGSYYVSAGARHVVPHQEGARSQQTVVSRP